MVAEIAEIDAREVPSSPIRLLLIATRFELPYRVLRCAQASGADVYVLGTSAAAPLRFSRHCKQFFLSDHPIHGGSDQNLVAQLRLITRTLAIEMIIPADDISMRSIIANESSLSTRCFPHPTLENFDILNNKWTFAALCSELSLPHPTTRLFPDVLCLEREIRNCTREQPMIAKPLSLSGGEGIVLFDGKQNNKRLQGISYQPILLQKFIYGRDICATLYASEGAIQSFIAYSVHRKTYTAYHDERLYLDLLNLVRRLNLDGLYNFDIRIAPDGSLYYLECNPRFFHKMDLTMVAGVNFVSPGIPGHDAQHSFMPSPVHVRLPQAVVRCAPWRLTRRDLDMAAYFLSDPAPYLIEKLRLHMLAAGASNAQRYRPA